MVKLHTNMRQRNDTTYSEVLNRIRTGDHTPEDIQLLRTRLTSGIVNYVMLNSALPCIYCQERSKLKSITHNG